MSLAKHQNIGLRLQQAQQRDLLCILLAMFLRLNAFNNIASQEDRTDTLFVDCAYIVEQHKPSLWLTLSLYLLIEKSNLWHHENKGCEQFSFYLTTMEQIFKLQNHQHYPTETAQRLPHL